jgi:hypothetical protein
MPPEDSARRHRRRARCRGPRLCTGVITASSVFFWPPEALRSLREGFAPVFQITCGGRVIGAGGSVVSNADRIAYSCPARSATTAQTASARYHWESDLTNTPSPRPANTTNSSASGYQSKSKSATCMTVHARPSPTYHVAGVVCHSFTARYAPRGRPRRQVVTHPALTFLYETTEPASKPASRRWSCVSVLQVLDFLDDCGEFGSFLGKRIFDGRRRGIFDSA